MSASASKGTQQPLPATTIGVRSSTALSLNLCGIGSLMGTAVCIVLAGVSSHVYGAVTDGGEELTACMTGNFIPHAQSRVKSKYPPRPFEVTRADAEQVLGAADRRVLDTALKFFCADGLFASKKRIIAELGLTDAQKRWNSHGDKYLGYTETFSWGREFEAGRWAVAFKNYGRLGSGREKWAIQLGLSPKQAICLDSKTIEGYLGLPFDTLSRTVPVINQSDKHGVGGRYTIPAQSNYRPALSIRLEGGCLRQLLLGGAYYVKDIGDEEIYD